MGMGMLSLSQLFNPAFQQKSSPRQYVKVWAWVYPTKTFKNTEILISSNFMSMKYYCNIFELFKNVKKKPLGLKIV